MAAKSGSGKKRAAFPLDHMYNNTSQYTHQELFHQKIFGKFFEVFRSFLKVLEVLGRFLKVVECLGSWCHLSMAEVSAGWLLGGILAVAVLDVEPGKRNRVVRSCM